MMTLMTAMALAAAAPPAPAPSMPMAPMQGVDMSQMDHSKMDHSSVAKGMACCCKDMAKGHDGEAADHAEHKDR
jgi:hypothetical protein